MSRQRAQKFADSNGLPLFEVSSLSDDSIDDVNAIFMTIALKLKQSRPLIPHSRDQVQFASFSVESFSLVHPRKVALYKSLKTLDYIVTSK